MTCKSKYEYMENWLLPSYDEKQIDMYAGKDVGALARAFHNIISSDKRKYCCVDNLRFARVDDCSANKKYNLQKSRGCCGFYDETVVINGKKYKIGFNYGH